MGAVDWSTLAWEVGLVVDYEISWGVHVEFAGELPDVLVERGLVGPYGLGLVLLVQFSGSE